MLHLTQPSWFPVYLTGYFNVADPSFNLSHVRLDIWRTNPQI